MPKPAELHYRQCTLRHGDRFLVSFIPEPYCEIGRTLRLKKGKNSPWSLGWAVTAVSDRVLESQLPDPHADSKRFGSIM